MNEKKLQKLINERSKIDFKISEIKQRQLVEVSLPALKKSVGKCFKYSNSYGHGARWPLYVKVVSIDEDTMTFKTLEFQKTSMDIIEIKFNHKFSYDGSNPFNSSDYTSIPTSEYNRAKKSLEKNIDRLMNES